jgi:hypothetical protein
MYNLDLNMVKLPYGNTTYHFQLNPRGGGWYCLRRLESLIDSISLLSEVRRITNYNIRTKFRQNKNRHIGMRLHTEDIVFYKDREMFSEGKKIETYKLGTDLKFIFILLEKSDYDILPEVISVELSYFIDTKFEIEKTDSYDISLFEIDDFETYRIYSISVDKNCSMKDWTSEVMKESNTQDEMDKKEREGSNNEKSFIDNLSTTYHSKYKIIKNPSKLLVTFSPFSNIENLTIFTLNQIVYQMSNGYMSFPYL